MWNQMQLRITIVILIRQQIGSLVLYVYIYLMHTVVLILKSTKDFNICFRLKYRIKFIQFIFSLLIIPAQLFKHFLTWLFLL